MRGYAYPLHNDTVLTNRINESLEEIVPAGQLITDMPPIMGSEDFPELAMHNKKTVYDYLIIGIAGPQSMAKAVAEVKKFPFYHHTADYLVDLSSIPAGTLIGATSILKIFKK
jgi:hippurate hydrolase